MLTPVCIFLLVAADIMYALLGEPNGPAAIFAFLAWLLLPTAIALWVRRDAKSRSHPLSYDFDSFVFFAWPILVPIYLFSTRGWGGLRIIGWFFLLYVLGFLSAEILVNLSILFYQLRSG